MKLISLKADYAFRELFSYENVRKQFLSDVLGIPLEEIKEVRVTTPFLWKRRARQKQGILDMALELNRGVKVNVEMQVRRQNAWTKRELFYLTKMYTEDLKAGQDYEKLHKCISIGLLDFNLTEREQYHSVYRLRETDGTELTDLLEIHIVELSKALRGTEAVDDWIRLFNVEKEEDLEMIKAKNAGIREAIGALKEMSLRKNLRYLYEEHMKRIRDRRGEDAYIRNQGKTLNLISLVRKKILKNHSAEEIADMLEEEVASIVLIYDLIRNNPNWNDEKICNELMNRSRDEER